MLLFIRLTAIVLALALPLTATAQDKKSQAPQGSLVVTTVSKADTVTPRSDFVGSVYFPEVSETASEVSGRVLDVHFEEGRRVKKGAPLVTLDTSLARKRLATARGNLEQARASLKLASIEFERRKLLLESGSIATQEYDSAYYSAKELESRVMGLAAEAERLELEIAKSRVPAPFDAVVLDRKVERGQWLAAGAAVGTLARDGDMDVIVNVPEPTLPFIAQGTEVEITAMDTRIQGVVRAVIPQGDVGTRTFPVKIRVPGGKGLAQGMRATAHLPVGIKVQAVIVPRDAVIILQDQPMVFSVADGKAAMIPVKVVAYMGLQAAVLGPGLAEGMPIVVKGNERLYPGAAVRTAQ